MSLKLYEICAELQQVIDSYNIDNEEGLIEFERVFDFLELEKEKKVINIGRLIKNLNAEYNAIASEIDNLAIRKNRLGKEIKGLENYLTNYIPGEKFNDPTVAISWRKSTSVNITDPTALPDDLLRLIPESYEPNKLEIKNRLSSGQVVIGAELVEKLNLQVK